MYSEHVRRLYILWSAFGLRCAPIFFFVFFLSFAQMVQPINLFTLFFMTAFYATISYRIELFFFSSSKSLIHTFMSSNADRFSSRLMKKKKNLMSGAYIFICLKICCSCAEIFVSAATEHTKRKSCGRKVMPTEKDTLFIFGWSMEQII